MNRKLNRLVMLVCLLALSLVFGSCDNGTPDPDPDNGGGNTGTTNSGGGGGKTGTFRIKITNIPSEVMSAENLFGLYPVNTTSYISSNALAGRNTELEGDDLTGPDWYEFSMYNTTPGSKYVGTAGNYDIAVINTNTNVKKILKNRRLEVGQTNTFSYTDFVAFE
jgi:hypothetical protein